MINYNKKNIINYIHKFLEKYYCGEFLNEADKIYILELLKYHPKYLSKFGVGVKNIQVVYNKINAKELWLIRVDGTKEDFSYYKCITKVSKINEIKKIARNEVSKYILEFKVNAFKINKYYTCPFTGEILTINNCHVDHEIKFDKLFNDFFNTIDVDNLEIINNGSSNKFFKNRQLAQQWIDFHNAHAILRVVSPFANLSILERL
jgi:hypothetical protein